MKLFIQKSVLTWGQHITLATELAIVQQQLEMYKELNTYAKSKLEEITRVLMENFDVKSEVVRAFVKWNKRTIGNPYFAFTTALANDYNSVSDEDFLVFGHIYNKLEDRYLNNETLKRFNSAMN